MDSYKTSLVNFDSNVYYRVMANDDSDSIKQL